VESLQGMTAIDVENLWTSTEADKNGRLSAGGRLWEIAKRNWRRDTKPLIIFSTPELVKSGWDALSDLSHQGILKRIVVDEFDVIGESSEKYRGAYLDLLPRLREKCRWCDRPIPIMLLTATATKQAILDLLDSANESSKAKMFLCQRALPDWHTYSVERKDSNSQVRNHDKGSLCLFPPSVSHFFLPGCQSRPSNPEGLRESLQVQGEGSVLLLAAIMLQRLCQTPQ
jgi:hypothetical protein